jgi:hypothetical protein
VGKLNRGRNYLWVGDRLGLYQSRPGLPKSRRPAWIVSEVGTTKGWVCGVTEEDNDWLGSHDWAPYKRSMDGKVRPVVQQGIDLLWVRVTTSAECKKVSAYSLFREGATNAAVKEPIEALINL